MKIPLPRLVTGILIGGVVLLLCGVAIFIFLCGRPQMIDLSQRWGRLAPFPKEAQNFSIRTEGSAFTRTFIGSFDASPEIISKWLRDSPGISEGKTQTNPDHSVKYILKTGEGAAYGEVIVSPARTRVSFSVSWS